MHFIIDAIDGSYFPHHLPYVAHFFCPESEFFEQEKLASVTHHDHHRYQLS